MKTTRDENPNQTEIEDRIVSPEPADLPALPPELVQLNRALVDNSIAPSTRAAYDRDWKAFIKWARGAGLQPIPASDRTVAAYVTYLVSLGRAPATIDRVVCSIAQAHKLLNHEPPQGSIIEKTRKGHKRAVGTAQEKARPLTREHIARILEALEEIPEPRRARDRALLAFGWAGALRRSEIAAVKVEQLEERAAGLVLFIPQSKTDAEGAGKHVGIPFGRLFCPVSLVNHWRQIGGVDRGPLFRSLRKGGRIQDRGIDGRAVDRIIRESAARAGYTERFSGHSLRAGFITSAAAAGTADREVMAHSRHTSARVFSGYVRPATVFDRNPVEALLGSIHDPIVEDPPPDPGRV